MSEFAAIAEAEVQADSRPDFDGLAGVYRWLEYLSFGPFLWRCRVWFLPRMKACRRALVLGDGDGRFTARLLRECPPIETTAVDLSERMIAALRRAVGSNVQRLRTEVADLRSWSPVQNAGYDLIATHFFLDCLNSDEAAALVKRVSTAAAPEACWVVSEFAVPAGWFGRVVAGPLIAALYLAFQWLTNLQVKQLPEYRRPLEDAGWWLDHEKRHLHGLLVSQLWRRSKQSM
jgi:SAM-dependent methyltransferase